MGGERGRADWDRRHAFVFSGIWTVPGYASQQGALGRLLGGWNLSGISYMQSGAPFTVVTGQNTAYNGTSNDSNSKKSDKETKAYCDLARTAKIQVYTVAFMAPTRGQELLKYCSTTTSHYYEAKDMAQLVAAFKTIGERAAGAYARLTK